MWLALSLLGFALTVTLHTVFVRMRGRLTMVASFLCVGIPIGAVITAVAFRLFGISDQSVASVLVYAAFCEVYILLMTFAANSVSASLMIRLRRQPITADELVKSYSTRAMVERRIDQLCAGGFMMEARGQFQLLRRGKLLAQTFVIARSFFKHRSLDFDAIQDRDPTARFPS